MPHKEISASIQAAVEFLDQPLLFGLIEVHHHVAAEDDVIALRQVLRLQIVKVEVHHFLQWLLDGIAFAHFVEVAQAVPVIDRRHLVLAIGAFLAVPLTGILHILVREAYNHMVLRKPLSTATVPEAMEGEA